MVSMTYLNAMEDMGIFKLLKIRLVSKGLSYRQLFWVTGFLVFSMSCVINGLTAGLLMGSVLIVAKVLALSLAKIAGIQGIR
jgi:Na+/H+ antiporter NhaD/arsenite permease-like protein